MSELLVTEENISDIFSVVTVFNIQDIECPVKLYCKNPEGIVIDTGVNYNEIRRYFKRQETFMTVRSYYGRIDILVDIHKDFRSFMVFATNLTLDKINEIYQKRINGEAYISLLGENRILLDATKMPNIDQGDFYASVYDTEPVRKGYRKFVDKAGEQSLKSTITSYIPDELAPYKNANYSWVVWMASEDDETESIMITDEKCQRTIMVKLR
jgi:hypothetical protein